MEDAGASRNLLSVVSSLDRLESQTQEEPSSSAPLRRRISTSTRAKASLTNIAGKLCRGKMFLRSLSLVLLIVMIITSSLQLRASLTGTPKLLLVRLQEPVPLGLQGNSQGHLEQRLSSVITLQEVPIELQMLMHSDTPASVLASTPHQT